MKKAIWDEFTPAALGNRIKNARKTKGLALEKLGSEASVSRAMAGHWETGRSDIKAPELVAICRALECSADDLLFGKRWWPFEGVDYASVAELDRDDIRRLEGALMAVAAQLGLEIKRHAA